MGRFQGELKSERHAGMCHTVMKCIRLPRGEACFRGLQVALTNCRGFERLVLRLDTSMH